VKPSGVGKNAVEASLSEPLRRDSILISYLAKGDGRTEPREVEGQRAP
jgi:hypothetical protein